MICSRAAQLSCSHLSDVDVVIRYVMGDEMSSACATYAQWLEDSTQVSAKALVNSSSSQ